MRAILLFLFLAFAPLDWLQRIALRNQYAQQAQQAYQSQQYQLAAVLYGKIVEQAQEDASPAVLLNLAHSYFHLEDYSQAAPLYRALLKTNPSQRTASIVASQLAVIEAEEGNFVKALEFCKRALIADESNATARYNFELLQKYLKQHPEKLKTLPPPKRPKKGQGGKPTQGKNGSSTAEGAGKANGLDGSGSVPGGASSGENAGNANQEKEQAQGDEAGKTRGTGPKGNQDSRGTNGPGSNQAGTEQDALLQTRFERLQKLQLSPEKARQLLDNMRQEEAQYLQQLPRRRKKAEETEGPDW